MTNESLKEILSKVDLTNLKPTATKADIASLCATARKYGTASVCIPPSYIEYAKQIAPDIKVCTVIGFPNGYNTTQVKVAEAADAVARGADEIDMVINVNNIMSGDFESVEKEIAEVRRVTKGKVLKVIIETCYLTDKQKARMCLIVARQNCDYIKTSTGFGTAGAKLEDIELFKKHIGKNVKIKAAGGIRTAEIMSEYVDAGCSRIGASSIDDILSRLE